MDTSDIGTGGERILEGGDKYGAGYVLAYTQPPLGGRKIAQKTCNTIETMTCTWTINNDTHRGDV